MEHGDDFSVEKLNCGAHMLNVGKHSYFMRNHQICHSLEVIRKKLKTLVPVNRLLALQVQRVGLRAVY